MIHKQVFISSTKDDLTDYRNAVKDIVLSFKLVPEMMELFPAIDETAIEISLGRVAQSDIYIGIFAHRYGYCPDGNEISITEMEFNQATKSRLHRLCYLIDEDIPWPQEHIENEPGKTKLRKLKERINTELVRQTFSSPDRLALEVAKSLSTLLDRPNLEIDIGPYRVFDMIRTADLPTASEVNTKSIAKVQLFIEGEVENFDKTTLVNALSGMLGIKREEIKISHIISGSIIIQIELPSEAADRLFTEKQVQLSREQELFEKLTERQKNILRYIYNHTSEFGFPPTIRQISENTNISSTSVVNYNLNKLTQAGYITRSQHASRSFKLIKSIPNKKLLPSETRIQVTAFSTPRIPVIGTIAASEPIPVPEDYSFDEDAMIEIPASLLGDADPNEVYGLRVIGDSMTDAMLREGDIVIMRRQFTAKNGDMIAVWLSDRSEVTLKYFFNEGDHIRLQPAHPQMKPIYVNPKYCRIEGKVIAVIRHL